jgi:hypothetical protein
MMHLSSMTRMIITLALAGLLAACATGQTDHTGHTGHTGRIAGEDAGVGVRGDLFGAEIDSRAFDNAYEIVRSLRPAWLHGRGAHSVASLHDRAVVYVDGIRAGGLEHLEQIRASSVASMRYLSAADATTRFGTGHAGGVIMVTTRQH